MVPERNIRFWEVLFYKAVSFSTYDMPGVIQSIGNMLSFRELAYWKKRKRK